MSAADVAVIIISGMAATLSGLVLYTFKSLKADVQTMTGKVDRQDVKIETLKDKMAACKVDCDRNTVSKEDWVRSEGYTRKEIKELTATMCRVETSLNVMNKIPEVVGGVVRAVVKELHEGDTRNG